MSDFVIDRLGVTAFLATKGFELLGTEPFRDNPKITAFRFADPQGTAAQAVAEYYNRGSVVADDFDHHLGRLKRLIWDRTSPDRQAVRR